jgi:UDPglucose 6-dehydrogenase
MQILEAVEAVNRRQKLVIVNKIKKHFGPKLKGKTIAIWGLAFKPNTDDMREAPVLNIVDALTREGVTIRAFDPAAMDEAKRRFGKSVKLCDSNYDALKGADGLVLLTEWNEFRRPDFDRIRTLLREAVVFDGRNIYDPRVMREKGFVYYGIGRNS